MELQIQDLVTSIKREGIEEAEKQKALIIEEAEKQARKIIAVAKEEAEKLAENTRRELQLEKENSISEAKRAARDIMLSFKQELSGILNGILAQRTSEKLGAAGFATLVKAALNGDDPGKYALEVATLTAELNSELADEIEKGLELRTLAGIEGFRLSAKDNSGFFDFTDEQIAELLKPYLSR